MLDRLLFNLKHWQMFLITLLVIFLNLYFLRGEAGVKGIIGEFLPGCILVLWIMLIGARLRKKLPPNYNGHFALFIVTGIFLITIGPLFSFYKMGLDPFFRSHPLLLFLFVLGFFAIGAVFMGFVARAMRALIIDRKPDVAEYGGDVFLWAIWLIGIWFLQPRLNRLYDRFYAH